MSGSAQIEAGRRRPSGQELLNDQPVLVLDHKSTPDRAQGQIEEQEALAMLRVVLETIDPLERELFLLRREGATYRKAAAKLGITEASAQKKFQRCSVAIATKIRQLRGGDVTAMLA